MSLGNQSLARVGASEPVTETLYARTRLIADATYELPSRQNSETLALNERIGPLVSHDGEQILDSYRTLENGLK